jgi:zinc protease
VRDKAQASRSGAASTVDLPGGSRLVLIPDPTLPYAGMSLTFTGGDALLAPSEQGLAELAASALTRGAGNRTAPQIEDFLADRAADLSAASGRDTFTVSAKFPTRFTGDMLGLAADVLGRPSFAPEEVERARRDQIASIKRREDQPMGLAFRHMFPFLFSGAPYGYFNEGLPEAVAGYGPGDLAGFWKRQSGRPFVLSVCGSFDPERITAFGRKLAVDLGRAEDGPVPFTIPAWSADKAKALKLADRNQAHLILVFPAVGEDHPDSAGLSLLRAALAGQSGLLFRDLRDRQSLGYSVTAFVWQAPRAGFLAFYIGTTPDKLDAAREGFRRAVASLDRDPLPEAELNRAKNILRGEYYQERQSLLSRSREASSLLTRGFELDRNARRVEEAQTLTPADLRDLAARYLKWDGAYEMVVAP